MGDKENALPPGASENDGLRAPMRFGPLSREPFSVRRRPQRGQALVGACRAASRHRQCVSLPLATPATGVLVARKASAPVVKHHCSPLGIPLSHPQELETGLVWESVESPAPMGFAQAPSVQRAGSTPSPVRPLYLTCRAPITLCCHS